MSPRNLQEVHDNAPNIVDHLRSSQIGAYVYPVVASQIRFFHTAPINVGNGDRDGIHCRNHLFGLTWLGNTVGGKCFYGRETEVGIVISY